MINIQGLTVRFNDHEVLKNINIDFEPSLVHGIVGLNGAGKNGKESIFETQCS